MSFSKTFARRVGAGSDPLLGSDGVPSGATSLQSSVAFTTPTRSGGAVAKGITVAISGPSSTITVALYQYDEPTMTWSLLSTATITTGQSADFPIINNLLDTSLQFYVRPLSGGQPDGTYIFYLAAGQSDPRSSAVGVPSGGATEGTLSTRASETTVATGFGNVLAQLDVDLSTRASESTLVEVRDRLGPQVAVIPGLGASGLSFRVIPTGEQGKDNCLGVVLANNVTVGVEARDKVESDPLAGTNAPGYPVRLVPEGVFYDQLNALARTIGPNPLDNAITVRAAVDALPDHSKGSSSGGILNVGSDGPILLFSIGAVQVSNGAGKWLFIHDALQATTLSDSTSTGFRYQLDQLQPDFFDRFAGAVPLKIVNGLRLAMSSMKNTFMLDAAQSFNAWYQIRTP